MRRSSLSPKILLCPSLYALEEAPVFNLSLCADILFTSSLRSSFVPRRINRLGLSQGVGPLLIDLPLGPPPVTALDLVNWHYIYSPVLGTVCTLTHNPHRRNAWLAAGRRISSYRPSLWFPIYNRLRPYELTLNCPSLNNALNTPVDCLTGPMKNHRLCYGGWTHALETVCYPAIRS